MSTIDARTDADLREELRRRIDALPAERLAMATTFLQYLDYLEEIASEDAFEAMDDPPYGPKFVAAMERAEADIKAGRVTPWRQVRDDV